ncbi:SITS-binding protein [Trichomycterus rosablanca]|uniref:SITS-binding protein n=1 Tax=Trichomycterus rosablanca TaxID=2290929 RepID=UPI002F360DDB
MPHGRTRNPSPIPEVTWDTGLKEMNETWKGAVACLGVAVFFVMTIGIIYWQVVDQPNKNWILKGSLSGLVWERRTHSLLVQTLTEEKTLVQIDVGHAGGADTDVPFVRNLCWLNKTEFCYTWDSVADVRISLNTGDQTETGTECYSMTWTPVHCHVQLKDCFSMLNVSWYGGGSVHAPRWPINDVDVSMQPFTVSDLHDNPTGFGSVLERYFLGSSGVAVLVAPDIPLHVGMESRQQFCLQTASMEQRPLQYTVCVGHNVKAVYQDSIQLLSTPIRELPSMDVLRLPFWKLPATVDLEAKIERELRTFSNRLKRHHLGEGVISLDEHSTSLLSNMDHDYYDGKRITSKRQSRDLPFVKLLNISITLSPYLSVDSWQFQTAIQDGLQNYWLSLPSGPQARMVPLLTQWRGKYCVKLNITNPEATNWFLERVSSLHSRLGMEYIMLEGGEGNPFEEQALRTPSALTGDEYIRLLAHLAENIGHNAIVSTGTRSSHKPLFIHMSALQSDWSYAGLKGIIPSLLHYSLLGYNFFIPDAVGGSLSTEMVMDNELFIRWLGIVAFLPVLSFQTPPWASGEDHVLNFTRKYIAKHHEFVVPLIEKYAEEWQATGNPIYRPLWWISPDDLTTFNIDDEFLIGDKVLVAPITEKGTLQRDIYLPGSDLQWQDANNDKVFDGGTLLQSYHIGLDVPVFIRKTS